MNLKRTVVHSPIGDMLIVTRGAALCALGFADLESELLQAIARRFGSTAIEKDTGPSPLDARLTSYFAGDLEALDDIALESPGTAFQRRVWAALRAIPPGETTSYSALAAAVGAPRAVRAVGTANGQNLAALVVPCHRVIRADGSLGGYAGGLERKRWLLGHERSRLVRPSHSLPGRTEAPRLRMGQAPQSDLVDGQGTN